MLLYTIYWVFVPAIIISAPLATIKKYEGYVMRMLGGMCTFHEGFEIIVNQEGRSATKWMQELPPEIKESIESPPEPLGTA